MSTTTNCRREEIALCKPDNNVLNEQKPEEKKTHQVCADAECMAISEKKFMRDHTLYSAISSWLFAISGATNIGVISVFSSKVLGAVEQGKPIFKSNDPKVPAVFSNKKYNYVALVATGLGGVAMGLSNWLESKKVVTEWQLGAGKLQRKTNGAEREQASSENQSPKNSNIEAPVNDAATKAQRKWVDSVQPHCEHAACCAER